MKTNRSRVAASSSSGKSAARDSVERGGAAGAFSFARGDVGAGADCPDCDTVVGIAGSTEGEREEGSSESSGTVRSTNANRGASSLASSTPAE